MNIYNYNMFDRDQILEELKENSYELECEQDKPENEIDHNKIFELTYRQFIKGLKISTGNNF